MAICEWLWVPGPDFCHDGIFKPVPIRERWISVLVFRWRVMILQLNKWATCNVVLTCYLTVMVYGSLVIECPLNLSSVRHLLLVRCLELVWVLKTGFEHFALAVSWIVTPYISVIRYKYFEGTCCLHLQDWKWPIWRQQVPLQNWYSWCPSVDTDLSWYKLMICKLMCLLKTMCLHLGMTSDYIWDCVTQHECVAMVEEFDNICKEWRKNSVFEQVMM
jgi:hypothetical protein